MKKKNLKKKQDTVFDTCKESSLIYLIFLIHLLEASLKILFLEGNAIIRAESNVCIRVWTNTDHKTSHMLEIT